MKTIIQIEEFLMFIVCAYGLYFLNAQWWFYPILLLGPDISMVAYLAGTKAGAIVYNLFHHRGIAVLILVAGIASGTWLLQALGLVLFGHASMDRALGYGLKHFTSFKSTHLGTIGNK